MTDRDTVERNPHPTKLGVWLSFCAGDCLVHIGRLAT